MIPMKCTKDLRYAGRPMKTGEEFQARGEKDARVLVAIGKAQRVDQPAGTYMNRAMTAAPPAQAAASMLPTVVKGDDLEQLDAEALHALAAQRGVKVHPLTGAKKLREVLAKAAE